MKFMRMLIIGISVMIMACSCGKIGGEESLESIQKKLFEIKSYKCDSEIIIKANKNTTKYYVRQYYLHPSMYRVEVIQPEFLSGLVTTSDGKETKISNPKITGNNVFVCDNMMKLSGNNMLIPYFFSNYVSSEKSDTIKKGEKYELITYIPKENNYMEKEVLTLTIKGVPEKLEIFDSKANPRITILYKDFVMNAKLDNKIFY